jgi:hypothetical protein
VTRHPFLGRRARTLLACMAGSGLLALAWWLWLPGGGFVALAWVFFVLTVGGWVGVTESGPLARTVEAVPEDESRR